jgi:hypothetical protein
VEKRYTLTAIHIKNVPGRELLGWTGEDARRSITSFEPYRGRPYHSPVHARNGSRSQERDPA